MSDASAASTTAPPQPLSPPEAPTEAPDSTPDGQPLSKKAQKKLAKAAYIAERKKERRAAEKERFATAAASVADRLDRRAGGATGVGAEVLAATPAPAAAAPR